MDGFENAYEAKKAEYDRLIKENKPENLPKIQALNTEMSALLHSMLEEVAKVKGDAANLQVYRDQLVQKLVKIQNDQSIILKQKDQYETLKMLQNHEQAKFDGAFFWYALSLGIVTVLFFIVLIWKGGYKVPEIPTMMSSTTTTPAFI